MVVVAVGSDVAQGVPAAQGAGVGDGRVAAAAPEASAAKPKRRVEVRSVMLTGLFLIALLWVLDFAEPVLVPAVLAVVLAIVLTPVVRAASWLKIPAALTALAAVVVAVGVVGGTVYLLSGPAMQWAGRMPKIVAELERKTRGLRESVAEVEEIGAQVGEMVAGDSPPPPGTLEVTVRDQQPVARVFAVEMGNVLVGGAMVFALAYFLLASGDGFLRKLVNVTPGLRGKVRAVTIVREVQREVSLYFATITLVNVGLGVVTGVAMWAMGLPNPVLWGVMAGILNYVPYLGAVVGTGLIGLIASAQFDTVGRVLWTMGIYYGLTIAESNVVTPLFLGRRMTLNPVMIFASLLLWGWLWGLAGVFLAVPILAVIKIVSDRVEGMGAIGEFVGGMKPKDEKAAEKAVEAVVAAA